MAESLRDLVVNLSLNSDNFSRNIKSINKQMSEAESAFKLAGAGVANFEGKTAGVQAKISMLQQKQSLLTKAVDQYTRKLAKHNDTLTAAVAKQEQLKDKLTALKQRFAELPSQISLASARYHAWNTAVGEGDARTQAAKAELDALEKEYKDVGAEIKKTNGQLDSNAKYMQKCADDVTDAQAKLNGVNADLKTTSAELKKLGSAWTTAGMKMESFGTKAQVVGKGLKSFGTASTRYVTTPLLALGVYSGKAAIDFEDNFAAVQKSVDGTVEQLADLKQSIKDMSLVKPTTATDIASVAETAGQLGVATEAISDFTAVMVDMGKVSSDLDADTAAELMAKFANITKMSTDNFDRLGSTVFKLGNTMATTEGGVAEMAMRLAAAGKQVGMSEADILGFAAALSSVGLEAQMGGTALSRTLVEMEVATINGGDALRDFAQVSGMTAEAFVSTWEKDPAEAFMAFLTGLSQMDEEGISAIATLQDMGLSEIRLRDTLLRATNANELFSDSLAAANEEWEKNSALSDAANLRYNTTKSRLTMLGNKAKLFAQDLGESMLPVLEQLMDKASGAMDKFMAMDDSTKTSVLKWGLLAAAIGPVSKLLGAIIGPIGSAAKGFGAFFKTVGAGETVLKGLSTASHGLLSPATGIVALSAAALYGMYKWYDYASGAKAAREALESMADTAARWKATGADSIYSGRSGLATFGLSKEDFTGATKTAQEWFDGLIKVWTDGKGETSEIVSEWSRSFADMTQGTITELEALRDAAAAGGHDGLTAQLQADIDELNAMNDEVEALLKKRQNGYLTDSEQQRLEQLLDRKEEIEIEYKLTPEGGGYDQILQNIQSEIAKAQARGEAGASFTVYGEALTAAAQGYAAVTDEIDAQYDAEYKLIQLMEAGKEQDAALSALNADYTQKRKAATEEYAQALKEVITPAWESEGVQQAKTDLQDLQTLMSLFNATGDEGYLTDMSDLFANMDEGDLTSYLGLLQQIQSLLDGGMSEEEIQAMFGSDIDMSNLLDQYAALAQFASDHDGQLSALSEAMNTLVPEEVQQICVDLDMSKAEERWAAFAEDPGAITTDAVISGYSVAPEVPQPTVDALVAAYKEIDDGASTVQLTPDEVVAQVSKYLEGEDCDITNLSPDQVEAIVNAYCEATGADKSELLPAFTAIVTAYDDSTATKPVIKTKVSITGYERTALDTFLETNPVKVDGVVRLSSLYENPEDSLDDPDATFWKDGVEITASVVPKELLTADTVAVLDEDGTIHVLVTPEIQGTGESAANAGGKLDESKVKGEIFGKKFTADWGWLNGLLGSSALEEMDYLTSMLKSYEQNKNTFADLFGLLDGTNRTGMESAIDRTFDPETAANIQTFVQEVVTALQNGEEVDEGTLEKFQAIIDLVSAMESADVGQEFTTGIGEALSAADYSGEADTVGGLLQEAMDSAGKMGAEGVGKGFAGYDYTADANAAANNLEGSFASSMQEHSPSRRMKPHGANVAAGVGAGMVEFSFAAHGAAVAANIESAIKTNMGSAAMRSLGFNASRGIASGILAGKSLVVSAMVQTVTAALNAAKERLDIHSPSGVFEDEVGLMSVKGIGAGFLKGIPEQGRIIANAARYLTGAARGGVSGGISNDNSRAYDQSSTVTLTGNTFVVRDDQDAYSLALEISQLTKSRQAGMGVRA